MDVICAYLTPEILKILNKFLILIINKILLVQSITGAIVYE